MSGKKTRIDDVDGCMECGACAKNCPADAISVTPGVGCASYIIQTWLKGKDAAACGNSECC
jgi:ferredoxin